jgi:hypothetical protein
MKRLTTRLLAAVFITAGAAGAQAIFTPFFGTASINGFVDPGTVLCPGGSQTGLWPGGAPCTPGSRAHVRGMVFAHTVDLNDNRVKGILTVTMNANTDGWTPAGPGSGPMWGAVRLEAEGGAVWEGTWTGSRTVTAAAGATAEVRGVLHGTSGTVEGLKAEFEIAFLGPDAFHGTCTGRILSPGAK